jgi:hypothetical protein
MLISNTTERLLYIFYIIDFMKSEIKRKATTSTVSVIECTDRDGWTGIQPALLGKASMWSSVLLGPARNGVKLANKRGRAGGRCLPDTNARPPRCPPSRRRWWRPPASLPWRCRQAWLHCLHLSLQQAHPRLPPPPRPGRCPKAVRRNAPPQPRLMVHPHLQLVPTRRPIGGVPASF